MRRVAPGWWLLLALALASCASLLTVGYLYRPVQVDGGWGSYGGFAISQDRDPYLHQGTVEEQQGVPGVKALFIFDTVSNTRALYMSVWYRLVGPRWQAVKAAGIVELLLLLGVAAVFFRRLLPTPELALMATALLATDKIVVLMAATDFRPDVAQATLACLFYLVLRGARTTLPATVGVALFAALAGAFSASAVTPVAVASIFRGAELLVGGFEAQKYRLGQLALAVVVAAGSYLLRQETIPRLIGAEREVLEPVTVAYLSEVWAGGLPAIVGKEAARWSSYFFFSNAPLFVAMLLGAALWLGSPARVRARWREAAPVWTAAIATMLILVVIDPFPRQQHLVPAMPFLLLLLHRVDALPDRLRRATMGVLASLVVLASGYGFVLARQLASHARAVGYSNAWLAETLRELAEADDELVVAGGTEFWSYWAPASNVTIFDRTRRGPVGSGLEPVLDRLDYAVLSADYAPERWLAWVRETYGVELRVLIDRRPYVLIADGFDRRADGGGSAPPPLP